MQHLRWRNASWTCSPHGARDIKPDGATVTTSTGPTQAEYRPWLDGIRAVAILLVLLDHTNWIKQWNLGGTGVGVFSRCQSI